MWAQGCRTPPAPVNIEPGFRRSTASDLGKPEIDFKGELVRGAKFFVSGTQHRNELGLGGTGRSGITGPFAPYIQLNI
jgi:hypothetical protein